MRTYTVVQNIHGCKAIAEQKSGGKRKKYMKSIFFQILLSMLGWRRETIMKEDIGLR